MAKKPEKPKSEKIEKIALDLGVVAFESHQVPNDPAKAKKVLTARANLAEKHFSATLEAGII